MNEFKEYSQGFDAFEKIAAKFQENPMEFKKQFTESEIAPACSCPESFPGGACSGLQ